MLVSEPTLRHAAAYCRRCGSCSAKLENCNIKAHPGQLHCFMQIRQAEAFPSASGTVNNLSQLVLAIWIIIHRHQT